MKLVPKKQLTTVKRGLVRPMLCACLLMALACSPLKQADKMAKKNTKTVLYPEYSFDERSHKAALIKGTATIRGVLFTKQKQGMLGNKGLLAPKIYGQGVRVTLFPATPYFMAWYNLRQKKENKRTVVYMSEQAFKYRIEATTDEYGRFTFEEMRPGKYFIQAFLTTVYSHTADVQVGTGYTSSGGSVAYFEKQNYNTRQHERLERFIEVKKDGEVVEVKLN
jgi:hypothetical protein